MPKLPTAPKPEEQIRPDALVRTIKNEKAPGNNKLKDIPVTPENYKKFRGETPTGRPHLPRGVVWGLIGLVVFFIIGSLISYAVARREMKKAITLQASTLKAGVADLQNFDTGSAIQQFSELSSSTSTPTLESLLGMFGSFFTGGKNAVSSFGDLANQLTNLSQEANGLGDGILAFATGSSTQPGLAVQLQQIRTSLGAIDADSNDLSGSLSELGASSTIGGTDFYLPLKAKIGSVESFLDTFIPWLANPTPHHILVLLQNPSEMRPGGGFLGSYADVTIASGSITDIAGRARR